MRNEEQERIEAQLKAVTAAQPSMETQQTDKEDTRPMVIRDTETETFMRRAPKAVAKANSDTGGSWDSSTDTDKPGSPAPRDVPAADDDEVEIILARKCKNCKSYGHHANVCPENKDLAKCYNCGEVSHVRKHCSKPEQEKKPRECYNCYQTGHIDNDCPNEKVLKCSNCDQIGHYREDCPKPRDWSRVQCHNCQRFGHTAVKCDQPTASSSKDADDVFDPMDSTDRNWGANASNAG